MRPFRFITYKGRSICFLPIPSIASLALKCGASYFGLKESSPILPFGGRACFFFKSYEKAENFCGVLRSLGFDVLADLWETRKLYKNGVYYHLVYFPVLEYVEKKVFIRSFPKLVKKYVHLTGNPFYHKN